MKRKELALWWASLGRRIFYTWLRVTRPEVHRRLCSLRWYQFWNTIITIDPIHTPFFSLALKEGSASLIHQWVTDDLKETSDEAQTTGDRHGDGRP